MVRTGMFAYALVVAAVLTLTAPGFGQDITGTYRCQGSFNNKRYNGTVEITRRGESYQVVWTIGDTMDRGTGILDGDVFAVGYEGNNSGVCLYKVQGNKLVGRWVRTEGKGLLHRETLTKQ